MNISHRILLPSSDWDDFASRLSDGDSESLERASAFMQHILDSLAIRPEGSKTFVTSSNIDEDDILSALLTEPDSPVGNLGNGQSVICVNSPLAMESQLIRPNRAANEDSYHTVLSVVTLEMTYQATQSSSSMPFAA